MSGLSTLDAGGAHSLALKPDGMVWTWGENYAGQMGDGPATDRSAPVRVSGVSGASAIAAGNNFNLALKTDGTVGVWGYNDKGQLGTVSTSQPTLR